MLANTLILLLLMTGKPALLVALPLALALPAAHGGDRAAGLSHRSARHDATPPGSFGLPGVSRRAPGLTA